MKEKIQELIGVEIKENVSLKECTTFKIGGPAKFFVRVNSPDLLYKALKAVKVLNLPFFILGKGSNVLVADSGFDGLVIKVENGANEIDGQIIKVFSGNVLGNIIREGLEHNLGGLEFAANIPGTIGGAIWGNAGAYGKGIGDYIDEVEIFAIEEKEVIMKVLTKEECQFSYRHSIFKNKENWVIAGAKLKLDKAEDGQKVLLEIQEEYKNRCAKQPLEFPSAGCTFKNVEYTSEMIKYERWMVNNKLPAAKLIEEAGMKGYKLGGAMVSDKHANFIINVNNATASDVIQLISMVKLRVRDELKIQLMEEVQYIGF